MEQGPSIEALSCFDEMQLEGVMPNTTLYLYTLKAYGHDGALCKLFQIHMEIIWRGFDCWPLHSNSLVDWYANCGALPEASQTFERFHDKSTFYWNALILGYASQGNSKEVFPLLERMEHGGLEANDITFIGVLNVCSHGGKLMQGHKCFKFMLLDAMIDTRCKKQKELNSPRYLILPHPQKRVTFASSLDDLCLVKIEYD